MKKWITTGLERVTSRALDSRLRESSQLASLAASVGRMNALLNTQRLGADSPLRDAEFQVYSQFGDDGIIQHLLTVLDVRKEEEVFVEFGVENYVESNTRFLLVNNNWRGLVLDGSKSNMEFVRRSNLHWKYDLTAVDAFINAENINDLIQEAGISGRIGLLSVDIDGNDFWVWKAINCIDPIVVIAEYNSLMGSERKIAIPYEPNFIRSHAHWSRMYYGASLGALCHLAEEKGYSFIGCNSAGNNAYFIKRDRMGGLKEIAPSIGYVESKFREREEDASHRRIRGQDRNKAIAGLPVVNVVSGQLETL